jgi:hypothetical protein
VRTASAILTACLVLSLGCYTTTYYNFAPEGQAAPQHSGSEPDDPQYWRHFWVYGWDPEELRIDAPAACGGSEHLEKLATEATFVQGLIATFAGYYINIYSPYSARVICDHSRRS